MARTRKKASPVSEKKASEGQEAMAAAEAEEPTPKADPEDYAIPATAKDVTPAKAAKGKVSEDLRKLAPKKPLEGTKRSPSYKIRDKAIEAQLSRGVHKGSGLPALEAGRWRVMRTQTLLMSGQVTDIREGAMVSTQTHDVKYLKRAGVALAATNQRARDIDKHGFEYDPRAAAQ